MQLNIYTIYFELFGKKMKTTITEETEEKAIQRLYTKIKFHKITSKKDEEFEQMIKDMNEWLK